LAVAAGCHNRLSINELGRQVRRPIFIVDPVCALDAEVIHRVVSTLADA